MTATDVERVMMNIDKIREQLALQDKQLALIDQQVQSITNRLEALSTNQDNLKKQIWLWAGALMVITPIAWLIVSNIIEGFTK